MSENTSAQGNSAVVAADEPLPIPEDHNGDIKTANGPRSALTAVLAELRGRKRVEPNTRLNALYLVNGSSATIPNLTKLAPQWPVKVHPGREELRKEINSWLKTVCKNEEELAGFLGSDVGGFAAAWAPEADSKVVKWVAYFYSWLILWDDKFETEATTGKIEKARDCQKQKQALDYIPKTLLPEDCEEVVEPSDPLLQVFKTRIADPLVESYEYERRLVLNEEIKDYFKSLEREYKVISRETLPTIEEFWEYRMGAVSSRFLIVANELVANVRLPVTLLKDPDMNDVWNSILEHAWLVNDILSAYKELLKDEISLLAILGPNGARLQAAVDIAVKAVATAVENFEASAQKLMEKVKDDEKTLADLKKYLDACRMSCQGFIAYSLDSPRYKLEHFKSEHGGGNLGVHMPSWPSSKFEELFTEKYKESLGR
jgi:hypothetical protein